MVSMFSSSRNIEKVFDEPNNLTVHATAELGQIVTETGIKASISVNRLVSTSHQAKYTQPEKS